MTLFARYPLIKFTYNDSLKDNLNYSHLLYKNVVVSSKLPQQQTEYLETNRKRYNYILLM